MHIRSILAIARKDALDILINKQTLFLLFFPIVMALLFLGLVALLGDGTKETHILMYDPGHTQIDQLAHSLFEKPIITYAGTPDEVSNTFGPDGSHKSVAYAFGLIIPENFNAQIQAGAQPRVLLYTNGDVMNAQDRQLLVRLLADYANTLAHPQPAIQITPSTTNPPSDKNSLTPEILGTTFTNSMLLVSFIIVAYFLPTLIVEEKEKKTIRMLMVSPASFADIMLGKLIVGLGYQLLLSLVVLAVMHGFTGNIPLVLLFMLAGILLTLTLGLLAGSIFKNTAEAGAVIGVLTLFFVMPPLFVGPIGQILTANSFSQIVKILPTYYIADGTFNALTNQGSTGNILLDLGVVAGCIIILFALAVWSLRRQAGVAATL